jgi:alkylation response protein AidB-like acyl-CoA dehydrogenase
MDLTLNQDQQSVRDVFADFFAKEATIGLLRDAETLGFSAELWASLTGTGAVVMGVPDAVGGGDATPIDLTLVAHEYGRRLAPVPLIEAMVACDVLARFEAGHGFIAAIADGDVVPTMTLRPAVDGVAKLVPAGAIADLAIGLDGDDLVVVTRSGERPYAPVPRNLGSSPIADWDLRADGQQRVVLASGAAARAAHDDALSLWRLLTAAALNGLRAEALEIAVAYVKSRNAFGAPIGSFMAIQHRLSDVAAAGEGLDLLVFEAAWARDNQPERFASLAAMAFLAAADIAFRTAREALQFHGGYGYTLEYDIQMYFRRAKAWPLAIGARGGQSQVLAGILFDTDHDSAEA